jgi:FecR protein
MRGNAGMARWLAVPANEAEAGLRKALDQAALREVDEVALRRVWARLAEIPALVPTQMTDPRLGERSASRGESDFGRRPRWPWIVAASLAGATAVLALMLVETKSEMRIARVESARMWQPASAIVSGKAQGADQRSALVAPATVRTGFGETLHLALTGGTEVILTSESTLILDDNDRPSVSGGEVQFRVPPQAPGRSFAVTAGAYQVVVVGTRFRVRVNQLNAAVGVDQGVVEIWSDHRRIARVAAGESWVSPATTRAVVDPVPGPAPGIGIAPPRQVASSSWRAAGPRATRFSKSMRAVKASGSTAAGVRQTLAMSSPSLGVSSSPSSSSSLGTSFAPGAASMGAGAGAGAGDGVLPLSVDQVPNIAPPAVPASAPTAVVDATPLAVQARAARAAGDSRRALGLYQTLAQRTGPAGENAEYEIGRVLRDGLHQPHEAVAAWRAYRAGHPRGLLRVEADLSVIETLVFVGDKAGALAEASEFVRRYPESERRMEVARLAGDLLRDRGDCAGAISAYNTAMDSVRGHRAVADGVTFHRSVCLLRGNRAEGMAALKVYLQAFPTGRYYSEAQRLLTDAPPAPSVAPGP